MSKDKNNSKKKGQNEESGVLESPQKKVGAQSVIETISIGISAGVAVAALVISILTAVQQSKFQIAEYEYKRPPVFQAYGAEPYVQSAIVDGEQVNVLYLSSFAFEFDAINNLDRLYGIAPDFTVEEIDKENIENSLRDYFLRSFSNKLPDIKNGDNWYFYRFIVLKSLDGSVSVQVYLYKTHPIRGGEEVVSNIMKLDDVTMLGFEKAHPNDENYDGERQIAAQYREILGFFSEFE